MSGHIERLYDEKCIILKNNFRKDSKFFVKKIITDYVVVNEKENLNYLFLLNLYYLNLNL